MTAVEWLEDNLIFEPWAEGRFKHNCKCWEQAKAMFEQQIIDAANWDSKSISENGIRKGDKYYNENFKKD